MDHISFLELGLYLRKKRLRKKLTQVEVANRLGYTSQFVANWERGISAPPLNALRQVIDMYGINSKEFYAAITAIQKKYWERALFNKKISNK